MRNAAYCVLRGGDQSVPIAMRHAVRSTHLLRCLLAAAFLLACAGCGRTSGDPRHGVTRVVVWSMWGGEEGRVFERLLAEYNRSHPSVHLENLSSVDDEKVIRAIIAADPPDLCTLSDPTDFGAMAANGAVLPLDEFFHRSGLRESDYTHASISQCKYRGRLYAIPYLVDCIVLLWNKDVFRQAGLDPERPPETMEDMVGACKQIAKRGEDGRIARVGLRPPEDTGVLLAIYGGGFYDEATGRVTADNPRNVEALAMYKRIVEAEGGVEAVEAFAKGFQEEQGAYNSFYLGQAGMIFNGQWNTYWIYRYRPSTHYGIAPLPYPRDHPERKGTAWLGGNLFCIPRGSRHVKEAWDFLVWTQSPQGQALFARTMHGVPNIRSALSDPTLRTGEPWRSAFGVFMDLSDSPNATHFPPMPSARLYAQELNNARDSVLYGTRTPQQALEAARVRVQRDMDHYRQAGR